MKIKVVNQSIVKFDCDIIIVNLFEGIKTPSGATGAVDKALGGMITKLIRTGEITGKLGKTTIIHTFDRLKAVRVMIVGLGKSVDFGPEDIRKVAGAAVKAAQEIKAKKVGSIVHGAGIGGLRSMKATQSLVEGSLLALYEFREYKKSKKDDIEEFCIVETAKKKIKELKKGAKIGQILARAQNTARDLINEPANNLTPKRLDRRIRKILKDNRLQNAIEQKIFDKAQMRRKGMGALLSVSQGSYNDPQFITLRIKNSKRPLICLIGKTVTFDSGGLSLKPPLGMEHMKGDMSGGAAVLGTTLALAELKSKVNLLTIIPAVENMPSGKASRPGDIVKAMNGKSIEIISTDAEGRMTLADAICYAEKMKAKTIIDIATLTGGCVGTFGDITAAVMGNDQRLIDTLLNISKQTGERMWQLPLFEEYEEQLKSTVAEIRNSGGRMAATITAGVFLQSFVDKARWLHIDVAGKELSAKKSFYTPKGGTGFGVRTLTEFLTKM